MKTKIIIEAEMSKEQSNVLISEIKEVASMIGIKLSDENVFYDQEFSDYGYDGRIKNYNIYYANELVDNLNFHSRKEAEGFIISQIKEKGNDWEGLEFSLFKIVFNNY